VNGKPGQILLPLALDSGNQEIWIARPYLQTLRPKLDYVGFNSQKVGNANSVLLKAFATQRFAPSKAIARRERYRPRRCRGWFRRWSGSLVTLLPPLFATHTFDPSKASTGVLSSMAYSRHSS